MSRRRRVNVDLCSSFQNLSVRDTVGRQARIPRRVQPPKSSVINPQLFNINHSGSKVVTYKNLHPSNAMYEKIDSLITNNDFVIENIVEVNNPFLEKAYQLKKAQKIKEFGEAYETLLFHGTKKAKVNTICTFNFDWRLYGQNSGHKYGKGVSFSTNAKYASCYSDTDSYNKVMIVAKVLIADVCQGNKNMVLPPPGYDTSQKGNSGVVVVKYEDSEFYPAYKLYYHIDDEDTEDDGDYDDEPVYYM